MIGSRQWMDLTQGKLKFKEKIKLINQVLIPTTLKYSRSFIQPRASSHSLQFKHIQIPDTALVQEAIHELSQCNHLAIIHHSWRSYFWGIGFAQIRKWHLDEESFIIACLMHDLGLVDHLEQYSCHCFTHESALRAERLCEKHHYPEIKTKNISNAICLHMNGYVDAQDSNLSKEVVLLQQATSCDVIGTDYALFPSLFKNDVLLQYPRAHFNAEMSKLVLKEAKNRPQSRTALMCKLGLPQMIEMNIFKE